MSVRQQPGQVPADPVEVGVCALCGQELIRTADDCWHPWDVARACPPEPRGPAALSDWYAAGNRTGRPGREHWRRNEEGSGA